MLKGIHQDYNAWYVELRNLIADLRGIDERHLVIDEGEALDCWLGKMTVEEAFTVLWMPDFDE